MFNIKITRKSLIVAFRNILIPVIILSSISGILSVFMYTYVVPQDYSAESQLLISPKEEKQNMFTNPFDLKYINTYSQLIYGEDLLGKVHEKYSNRKKYSTKYIKDHLIVLLSTDSQVITIQVITPQKKNSIELANLIGEEAEKYIPTVLDTNKINLISKARKANKIIGMTKKSYVLLSTTLFFIVYCLGGLTFLLFNRKLYFIDQVEEILQTGRIYKMKK